MKFIATSPFEIKIRQSLIGRTEGLTIEKLKEAKRLFLKSAPKAKKRKVK